MKLIIFILILKLIIINFNFNLVYSKISTSSLSSNEDNNNNNKPIFYTLDNICEFTNSINESDSFELYYVQSPLMYAIYGNLFEKINAYHSGIALYNINGGSNITADYFAGPNLVNALMPQNITKDDQGNYNLTWNTYGLIEVSNYINETYWIKRQLLMYEITGTQVKQFLSWLPIYNQTHPVYNLFSIADGSSSDSGSSGISGIADSGIKEYLYNKIFKKPSTTNSNEIIYQYSSTCDDFVWSCFNSLYQLGGKFIGMQSNPNKDQVTLFTKVPPSIVDYNNVTERNEIANFYLNMISIAEHKNDTAAEIFSKLVSLFNGTFYTYINGIYYKLELSSSPSFTYDPSPIPSGIQNSSSIELLDGCISPPTPPPAQSNKLFFNKFTTIQFIFLIIGISLFGTIILYLSIGLVINKIKGKKGTNLIPNKQFWTSIGNSSKNKYKPLIYDVNESTIQ